jgi:RimJ/RimL family protein N-acetyltransferase
MIATAPDSGVIPLLDGTNVPVRPIAGEDAPALQRFHARLSERSIYQRFFGHLPQLSDERARYFTRLDGRDRVALVALDPAAPTEIIAVVRFDREIGTEQAEYAAIVADRWQGRGLGTALTQRLLAVARDRGIRLVYALVLPENARMLNLLRDLALPERLRHVDGIARVEIDIVDQSDRRKVGQS